MGFGSLRVVGQRYRLICSVDPAARLVYVVAAGLRREGAHDDVYELARRSSNSAWPLLPRSRRHLSPPAGAGNDDWIACRPESGNTRSARLTPSSRSTRNTTQRLRWSRNCFGSTPDIQARPQFFPRLGSLYLHGLAALDLETIIVVTMFAIRLDQDAVAEIGELRASERKRVLDAIEKQLAHEPAEASRRRKMLSGLAPPWEQVRPVWQLRVGDLRVFYDVDESGRTVTVRSVRRKERKRTEEIL